SRRHGADRGRQPPRAARRRARRRRQGSRREPEGPSGRAHARVPLGRRHPVTAADYYAKTAGNYAKTAGNERRLPATTPRLPATTPRLPAKRPRLLGEFEGVAPLNNKELHMARVAILDDYQNVAR